MKDLGFGAPCECGKPDCRDCLEAAALAALVREEFDQTRRQARVPTPEIVWWRAQMRAREQAARTAARPILLSQALAIAALIGLLVSVVGRLTVPAILWRDMALAPTALPVLTIAIVAACCLLIAPLAIYFALSRE